MEKSLKRKRDCDRNREVTSQSGPDDCGGHEWSKHYGYSERNRDWDHWPSHHSLEEQGARKDRRRPRRSSMEHGYSCGRDEAKNTIGVGRNAKPSSGRLADSILGGAKDLPEGR